MQRTGNKTDRLTLELRRRIAGMADGEAFPTMRQLIGEYGVSLPTVTAALKRLKTLGLLAAHVGRGTFVSRPDSGRKRILLLQSDWPSEYITSIIPHIRSAVESLGCEYLHQTYDHRLETPPAFADYHADLIIHDSPTKPQLTPENIESIAHTPVPVMICRSEVPVEGLHYVCDDNHAAGAEIAAYLHRMGHRKVALLFNEPVALERSLHFRRRGFETFASIHHMEVEFRDCEVHPGERANQKIEAFARRIQSGDFAFTAVFVISNAGANYLARKLKELGVRIPEEISIVTEGDFPPGGEVTAFAVPPEDYTRAIAELAGRLLARSGGDTQINLPVSLINRHSVADITVNQGE